MATGSCMKWGGRIHPVVAYVYGEPGNRVMGKEVAAVLGVSPSTVRRLAMTYVELRPTETVRACGVEVWMYDIDQADFFEARLKGRDDEGACRPGTPRLWSDRERRMRRARTSEACYRRRRAKLLLAWGDKSGADQQFKLAQAITAELRADAETRRLELGPGISWFDQEF